MKKSTSNKVAKRDDPFVGIPEEERRETSMVAVMSVYMGCKALTPQEAWSKLQAMRAQDAAEAVKKQAENAQQRADNVRKYAIQDLLPALNQLVSARDVMYAIEHDLEGVSYLEHDTLAGFARLAVSEAGEKLEQALCNLGLVPEQKYAYFVDDLKSEGVKMEPVPEEDDEQDQKAA